MYTALAAKLIAETEDIGVRADPDAAGTSAWASGRLGRMLTVTTTIMTTALAARRGGAVDCPPSDTLTRPGAVASTRVAPLDKAVPLKIWKSLHHAVPLEACPLRQFPPMSSARGHHAARPTVPSSGFRVDPIA